MKKIEFVQTAANGGFPCPNGQGIAHGEPVYIVKKRELDELESGKGIKSGYVQIGQMYELHKTGQIYKVVKIDELQDNNERLIGYEKYPKVEDRIYWRTENDFLKVLYFPLTHPGDVTIHPRFKYLGNLP